MSSPVLKGQIVYEDHGSSIWGKIGSVLSGAGHVLASALPYVAQAASIYASSRGGPSNAFDYNDASWDLPNQNNRRSLAMPIPEPIALRPIPDYKSVPIARNALDKLKQQQDYRQPSAPSWVELQARNQQILNELAAAKSLPNYQQFHQNSGVAYDFRPKASQLGAGQLMQQSRQSNGFIQENVRQIQDNLAHARQPVPTGLKRHLAQVRQSGIRPPDESSALHQMIRRSNAAPTQTVPKPKAQLKVAEVHSKEYLNTRQQLLNKLFGSQVFDRTDLQTPYELKDGQKVDDPNIARMTAVANWILFRSKSTQWNDPQVQQLQSVLQAGRENAISSSQIRQLDIAAKLHTILKNNEELPGFQRDDAKALALGMQLLINANTHQGKIDERQLIEDIQLFTIDAGKYEAGRLLRQAKESNAAYNLFAGPRIGTIGWKEKYRDQGKQYEIDKDGNEKPINQTHHFTFFFTKGLLAGSDTATELKKVAAIGIDIPNKPDRDLGILAVDIGRKVRTGKIHWRDLPRIIYEELKE
jgi:hypothetical protein